jgi:hypothetical protein
MKNLVPFLLFAFAALGFVWSVEACVALLRQLLGV